MKDLFCFVYICIDDKFKIFFFGSFIVDGKYFYSKVLKEFEDIKEGFLIISGFKFILIVFKIFKGRYFKYLEINLEVKLGIS